MRDPGLEQAIAKAGGVGVLARALGIAQPSVSGWARIPADRVAAVEALTKLPRHVLRPDLFPAATGSAIDDIDRLRADEYALLALLLGQAPTADLLERLAALKGDATELGLARVALADAAAQTNADAVSREFFTLFVGVGRGDVLPYASWYLTGFLHDRPLARVRADFDRLGVERTGLREEPEDHIAILLETMAGLVAREFGAEGSEESLKDQQAFFDAHIAPWALRLMVDLETAPAARFYRAVGLLGRVFLEIEKEAFALPA